MSSRSIVDRVLLLAAAVCAGRPCLAAHRLADIERPRPLDPYHRDRVERLGSSAGQSAADDSAGRVRHPCGLPRLRRDEMVGKAIDTADGAPAPLDHSAPANDLLGPPILPLPSSASAVPAPAPAPAPATSAAPVAAPALPTAAATETSPEPAVGDGSGEAVPKPAGDPPPAETAALPPADAAPEPTDAKTAQKGAVNINNASVDVLNRLPGAGRIGQAIANHRPYRSVEDLLKKRVVRRSVYEQIKGELAAE